jgi:hypothetical protein
VQVYLDGKDSEGRTKYLNEDMTTHAHQGTGPAATTTQQLMMNKQVSKEEIVTLLRIINSKLDRLLIETSNSNRHDAERELTE